MHINSRSALYWIPKLESQYMGQEAEELFTVANDTRDWSPSLVYVQIYYKLQRKENVLYVKVGGQNW